MKKRIVFRVACKFLTYLCGILILPFFGILGPGGLGAVPWQPQSTALCTDTKSHNKVTTINKNKKGSRNTIQKRNNRRNSSSSPRGQRDNQRQVFLWCDNKRQTSDNTDTSLHFVYNVKRIGLVSQRRPKVAQNCTNPLPLVLRIPVLCSCHPI